MGETATQTTGTDTLDDAPYVYVEPADRIRAVAADGGIDLDEDRIRSYAERGREGYEVWQLVGALIETIATLVETTANGDPTMARIALQVGAERVVAWEQAKAQAGDGSATRS